jgi:hypothetical protein
MRNPAKIGLVALMSFSLGATAKAKTGKSDDKPTGVQRYQREATRARLLDLGLNPPQSRLVVTGSYPTGAARAFIEFYVDRIHSKQSEFDNLGMRYATLRLLRDSGSQNDETEFETWSREFEEVAQRYNDFLVDPAWTETLHEWARLAEGLKGQLPDLARRMAKERDLESYPPELKPALDEIEKLEQEYEDALRSAPANADLGDFGQRLVAVRRQVKTGEIPFAEGQKIVRELFAKTGYHYVGYQAAQAKGENLNRIAILRTQLAKAKGFPTWAAYVLEMSGQGYTPEFRGPANQKLFLRRYLEALRPLEKAYIDSRLAEAGLSPEQRADLRNQDIGFLTGPGLELLQPYFPNDRITSIWEKVLLESGFKPETLNQILVDDGFRDGKNRSMAYLSGLLPPYNTTTVLDSDRLEFRGMSKAKDKLKDGFVYILQSYKGMGISDLSTAFHEGGHATEKILKYKDKPVNEAYGYVEVPSITSEHFTKDAEVLWHHAVPVDGRKPSLEEIERLISNSEKKEVINIAGLAGQSLLDLELWDYDYTQPGAQTFLQRVESVGRETESLTFDFGDVDSPVPFYYHNVATTHFTSGNVRNIGYDYAGIASHMMADYISDELEKVSGRRSWYNQPEFARIFAEKFVSVGWRKPFPANIEAITGRKFDPMTVVSDMARRIASGPEVCEALLQTAARTRK